MADKSGVLLVKMVPKYDSARTTLKRSPVKTIELFNSKAVWERRPNSLWQSHWAFLVNGALEPEVCPSQQDVFALDKDKASEQQHNTEAIKTTAASNAIDILGSLFITIKVYTSKCCLSSRAFNL